MNYVALAWAIRVFCIISFLISLSVIRRTRLSWKLSEDTKEKEEQKYFNYVNESSLWANGVVLIIIFISTIPGACESMNGLWFMSWSVAKGILLMFQIIRLQTLLSKQQMQFFKSFPKYVYYALYIIEAFCIIYNLSLSYFTFDIKVIDDTLCLEQVKGDSSLFLEYQLPVIIIDFFVQAIILCLYLQKLIKAMIVIQRQGEYGESTAIRLKSVLDKMMLLECILLVCAVVQWLVYGAVVHSPEDIQYLIINIIHVAGSLICVIIGYYGIERQVEIQSIFMQCARWYNTNNEKKKAKNTPEITEDVPVQSDGMKTGEDEEALVQRPVQLQSADTQSNHPLPNPLEAGNASPVSPASDQTELMMMNQMNRKE